MTHKNQKGFTLGEALITVAIGAFVIMAVGSTLDTGIFTAKDNRARMYATNGLRTELEALRMAAFDSIVPGSFMNDMVQRLPGGAGAIATALSFGPDIKKVTLTVNWVGSRGAVMSVSLTTNFTRKGLNGQ